MKKIEAKRKVAKRSATPKGKRLRAVVPPEEVEMVERLAAEVLAGERTAESAIASLLVGREMP